MLGFGKKKPSDIEAKVKAALEKLPPANIPEEKFKIPAFAYKKIEGSFGIMSRKDEKVTNIAWEGCRDRFQNSTNPEEVMDFLFYHEAGAGDHVIEFVRTIEQVIMNTKDSTFTEADRVVFMKTNNSQVLYVRMSAWWKYAIRRSFLTAVLRAGQKYTERTAKAFEKALFSQYYLQSTKPAVNCFLSGRTGSKLKKRARTSFPGWYAHFNGKTEDKVRETLVKVLPDGHPKKPKKEEPAPEGAAAAPEAVAAPVVTPDGAGVQG